MESEKLATFTTRKKIMVSISKKNDFNLKPILDELSNSRELKQDGSMAIKGFGALDEFESYLLTAIMGKNHTNSFLRAVVKKAMNSQQTLTEGEFIKQCNFFAGKLERSAKNNYKVIFPIWGASGLLSGKRRWGDVTITFDINRRTPFAKRAQKERALQLEKRGVNLRVSPKKLETLPLCMCSVKAINIWDAFEKAEDAVSKELGLHSIFMSRGKFIFTQEPDTPINTILLAPHMTVHEKSGKMSADIYWYNRWPDYLKEKNIISSELQSRNEQANSLRKHLQKLPWRQEAESALSRYYSAFSQCDLEASFLDGWRLLESIGGRSREKSETLIKRAAWLYEERDLNHQLGLHLMHRRNLISHGRPVKEDSNEVLAFQMKRFLTPLLHAFLTNPFKLKNLEEFWSLCDMPVEKSTRQRQAYLLECAAKFRHEK